MPQSSILAQSIQAPKSFGHGLTRARWRSRRRWGTQPAQQIIHGGKCCGRWCCCCRRLLLAQHDVSTRAQVSTASSLISKFSSTSSPASRHITECDGKPYTEHPA